MVSSTSKDFYYGMISTLHNDDHRVLRWMNDPNVRYGSFIKFASDKDEVQHTFILVKVNSTTIGIVDVNGDYKQVGLPTARVVNKLSGLVPIVYAVRPDNLDEMIDAGITHLCMKYTDVVTRLYKDHGILRPININLRYR